MRLGFALISVLAAGLAQQSTDPNLLAAESHLRSGDYARAAEAAELALKVNPKVDPEAYIMLAVARLNLNDSAGAAGACDRGLEAFPRLLRVQRHCADLYSEVLPPREAAAKLEAALAAAPASAFLQRGLARALLRQGTKEPRCAGLLEPAVKADPRDIETRLLYCQCICLTRMDGECAAAARAALPFVPESELAARLQVQVLLAMAEGRQGNNTAARAEHMRAQALNRRMPQPVPSVDVEFGKFLGNTGDDAAAEKVLTRVTTAAPEYAPGRFELAKVAFRLGQQQRAADEAEAALPGTTDPVEKRAIHSFLVRTYNAIGKVKQAQQHQEQVEALR